MIASVAPTQRAIAEFISDQNNHVDDHDNDHVHDDHNARDDHDDGDCKYFWRWSPKSYRNIYLGLEQFPWWEGKGGNSTEGDLPETFSVSG